MTETSAKIQEMLCKSLLRIATSPDLTGSEVNRVNQFAMRLIAEFSVLKAKDDAALMKAGTTVAPSKTSPPRPPSDLA